MRRTRIRLSLVLVLLLALPGCRAIEDMKVKGQFKKVAAQASDPIERLKNEEGALAATRKYAESRMGRADTPTGKLVVGFRGLDELYDRLGATDRAVRRLLDALPAMENPWLDKVKSKGEIAATVCAGKPNATYASTSITLVDCDVAMAGLADAIDRMSAESRRRGVEMPYLRDGNPVVK